MYNILLGGIDKPHHHHQDTLGDDQEEVPEEDEVDDDVVDDPDEIPRPDTPVAHTLAENTDYGWD